MRTITKILLSAFVFSILVFAGTGLSSANTDGNVFVANANAAQSEAMPQDGVIITEEDVVCSCCHSHAHTNSVFDRYACFFCKIGRFFRKMYGKDETDPTHKYLLTESIEPTCVSEGKRTYECGVCKKSCSFTDNVLPHTPETISGVLPTCTETGISDGSKCADCGQILSEQTPLSALGHAEVIDAAVAPTCTAGGISEGKHCGRCSTVLTAQENLPALGHDFADGDTVSDLKVYRTGTSATTADIKCFRCSQSFNDFPVNAAASVGGYTKIYHTLEAAVAAARNTNVYLISDYTLKDNMTIGNGVTVVIPYVAGDTGYFTRDNDDGFYTKYCADNMTQTINKHCFRRLTVPADKTITVANSGTLFISAMTGLFGGGNPASYGISGGYGEIALAGTINVSSGGIFDCSGFVTNQGGTVNLANGAKMFETYGILYWRGGSYGNAAKSKSIYPIDGYEMNYMRATLNINAGAILAGNCKMCAGSLSNIGESQYYYCHFKFLGYGDGYLYLLENGARAQRTVEANGRTTMKFYGNITFGISSITVGAISLKTSSYQAYKVDGNYRFEFYDGTITCNQKVQFMPGSEVIVGRGATFDITGTGALIFCTANNYTVSGTSYPGYYSYDSRYVGALYPVGRDDAKLYVKDGGTVNVKGKSLLGNKATLAGIVYIDSASTVSFEKYAKTEFELKVAVGAISGASILASVDAEKYTVPYIRRTLS